MAAQLEVQPTTARRGTALQINVYPMDVRHVEILLPHHIRVWGAAVDRVVVTVDVHQSRSGRYRGGNFLTNLARLRQVLQAIGRDCPKLEVIEVDYSAAAVQRVGEYFFKSARVPVKAWDGGPFYAYFFGLLTANARYVVHFDGDMLFGGDGSSWTAEALQMLQQKPDVLMVCPLPGPPHPGGVIAGHQQDIGYTFAPEPWSSAAFRFAHASTRFFLIDMQRFEEKLQPLPLSPPSLVQRIKARILGNPPEVLEAEVLLSRALREHGLARIDFLGSGRGLWTLHPPYRSERFYAELPAIVSRVESGDMPEGQLGDYELNDSVIDWSDARARNRRSQRYLRHLKHQLARFF